MCRFLIKILAARTKLVTAWSVTDHLIRASKFLTAKCIVFTVAVHAISHVTKTHFAMHLTVK